MHEPLVTGGTVVTPGSSQPLDVAVDGEQVTAIDQPGSLDNEAAHIVDATGCLVIPGGADPHGNRLGVEAISSSDGSLLRAPANTKALEQRILAAFDGLTRKQKQLARFMLDKQVQLAFSSAEEVGREAGVDAATVVRFSRLLGYEGFAHLRDSVRSSVPEFLTAVEKVSRTLAKPSASSDIVAQVFSQDLRNIEETARANSPEILADAVRMLARAKRVYVLGMGMSHPIAAVLSHQLLLIGVRAERVPGDLVAAAAALSEMSAKDALVTISLWRYLKDSVRLFESARSSGAKTMLMTDSRLSPLAAEAEITLTASTEAAELSHSLVSLVTLTNVLATGVALSNPQRTLGRLRKIDEFYDRFGVMSD
jgi:DNA-binding MurR/RpiR family transcriptional regulator